MGKRQELLFAFLDLVILACCSTSLMMQTHAHPTGEQAEEGKEGGEPVLHEEAVESQVLDHHDHDNHDDDDEEDEDEEDDVQDVAEEDDDEGWITPSNIKKIKEDARRKEQTPLPPAKVACITTDFAMQNVLLQMRIRVISVDGLAIRTAKTWILRCHACFK